jgi:hypothetical protein
MHKLLDSGCDLLRRHSAFELKIGSLVTIVASGTYLVRW